MSNKSKILLLALLILIVAGYLVYRGRVEERNQVAQFSAALPPAQDSSGGDAENSAVLDEISEQELQEFNARCESGEWIEIGDAPGEAIALTGKLRRVYPEDDIAQELKDFEYYVEGKEKTALAGSDLSAFDNLEDREVEVRGARSADGKSVIALQARCAGAETDKTAIETRAKLMDWIAANIDSLAPERAPYQKWIVLSAGFVDEKSVYIEYYDTVEDDEDSNVEEDTWRQALVEASAKPSGGFDAKVLAYWKMEEDEEVLKSGKDKFEDVEDVVMYDYDAEEKSWTRI